MASQTDEQPKKENASETSVTEKTQEPKKVGSLYGTFEMTTLLFLTIIAVLTVSEMASREAFKNSVTLKIASLNNDLANIASSLTPSSGNTQTDLYVQRDRISKNITIFKNIEDKAGTLINIGSSNEKGTLANLTIEYQTAVRNYEETGDASGKNTFLSNISYTYFLRFIYEARSDHLLALSIICCSAIGALIFGLRAGEKMGLRTMTSGLATGFVVYLALKGGQHLFLITSPEARIPTNPYSSAFAGLLAGLFSDKAYKVLNTLVDGLVSQVENTAGSNNQNDTQN